MIGLVLDLGCGTGDNALAIAATGLDVVGVDVSSTAIEMARTKATHRALPTHFAVADALQLRGLNRQFRTAIDCGLFHTFDADEQQRYAASVSTVTARDGRLYVLCFSDQGATQGPHPVSQSDLRRAFHAGAGWDVVSITADYTYARFQADGIPAWLATVTRL